jgi:RNA polymerase sigma-70 factor (ECF subfamily)
LALPTAIAPDPEYENVERRLSLPPEALAAIAGLSDAERSLLELRVVEECRYDEIADRLSISPQAARLRVSRALRRLKLALGGDQQ